MASINISKFIIASMVFLIPRRAYSKREKYLVMNQW